MNLEPQHTMLIVMDIQEKLFNAMPETRNDMINNCQKLIKAAGILKIPIIITEQYPKGLGKTVENIKKFLPSDVTLMEKTEFSCVNNNQIIDKIKNLNKKNVVLCGLETHICIYQSARDLAKTGHSVHVPVDAVHSRRKMDWKTGVKLIEKSDAIPTTTETVIFDLMKAADTSEFREISRLLK